MNDCRDNSVQARTILVIDDEAVEKAFRKDFEAATQKAEKKVVKLHLPKLNVAKVLCIPHFMGGTISGPQ